MTIKRRLAPLPPRAVAGRNTTLSVQLNRPPAVPQVDPVECPECEPAAPEGTSYLIFAPFDELETRQTDIGTETDEMVIEECQWFDRRTKTDGATSVWVEVLGTTTGPPFSYTGHMRISGNNFGSAAESGYMTWANADGSPTDLSALIDTMRFEVHGLDYGFDNNTMGIRIRFTDADGTQATVEESSSFFDKWPYPEDDVNWIEVDISSVAATIDTTRVTEVRMEFFFDKASSSEYMLMDFKRILLSAWVILFPGTAPT